MPHNGLVVALAKRIPPSLNLVRLHRGYAIRGRPSTSDSRFVGKCGKSGKHDYM